MNKNDLKNRTKKFAFNIIRLTESFPRNTLGRIIENQIIRSATSSAANYRAVCRARSRADFIAKLGIVIEELDETSYWLELILDTKSIKNTIILEQLAKESNELTAIMVASKKSTSANLKSKI